MAVELRKWQAEAVKRSEKDCPGIFLEALGGRGKTICAYEIAKHKGAKKVTVLNNRLNIISGWIETYKNLGYDQFFELETMTDKRMQNSLADGEILECDVLIIDEWQNMSSESNYKAYKKIKRDYSIGLSATPMRKKGQNFYPMEKTIFGKAEPNQKENWQLQHGKMKYSRFAYSKQDRFIDATKFGELLYYNPHSTYEQLKTALLNNEIADHLKNMNFGLVRNSHHGLAEMYAEKEDYYSALRHYIEVILLDCSGLSNFYGHIENPIYRKDMLNSYQVTAMRNCAEECDLDDYNSAFLEAKNDIKSFKKKIFLSDKDFDFIRINLLTEDLYVIEDYLRKFEKFDYEYYTK